MKSGDLFKRMECKEVCNKVIVFRRKTSMVVYFQHFTLKFENGPCLIHSI